MKITFNWKVTIIGTILLFVFFVSIHAQAMYVGLRFRHFWVGKNYTLYMREDKTDEIPNANIVLYKDHIYEYTQNELTGGGQFSAGRWQEKNDGEIVLLSDEKLYRKVYKRRKRSGIIIGYPFFDAKLLLKFSDGRKVLTIVNSNYQ